MLNSSLGVFDYMGRYICPIGSSLASNLTLGIGTCLGYLNSDEPLVEGCPVVCFRLSSQINDSRHGAVGVCDVLGTAIGFS